MNLVATSLRSVRVATALGAVRDNLQGRIYSDTSRERLEKPPSL
jgi:hypothetical protein